MQQVIRPDHGRALHARGLVGTIAPPGICNSGMGRARKSPRQARPSQRAHRAERCTRALSVAMPVFAYICRYIFDTRTNAMRAFIDRTTFERAQMDLQL